MVKPIMVFISLFLLTACSGTIGPLAIVTQASSPSSIPAILSPTPPFFPSITSTTTTLSLTMTTTPVISPTVILTAAPTLTAALVLNITGCNTSLDITHQMGEVTNAYPLIRNNTGIDLTNVCAILTASDEARIHPDKRSCIASLPNGDQVILKLTVDTGFKQDTSVQVDVTSNEGSTAFINRNSCTEIGLPGWVPAKIGVVEPIP